MVIHSLPGHRWAQSSNRCLGCRLLEIFATENSRIQSKTLSNLLIPAWNMKVYEQRESLGCFSHTSPDTEMSCKVAWFLPGAGWASSWEANAEANGLWELEGECCQHNSQCSSPAFPPQGSSPVPLSCSRTTKFKVAEGQRLFSKEPVEQTGNWEKPALMQSTRWHMAPT